MSRPWTVTICCMVSLGLAAWDVATALLVEESVEPPGFSVIYVLIGIVPVIFAVAAFLRRRWGRLWLVPQSSLCCCCCLHRTAGFEIPVRHWRFTIAEQLAPYFRCILRR